MTRLLLLGTWTAGIWTAWVVLALIANRIREDDRKNVRMVYDPQTESVRLALVYDYTVFDPRAARPDAAPEHIR